MEKKYLIANIQIPMMITQDGKYESFTDLITVDFTPCTELPNKSSNINQTVNDKYKEMLKNLFAPQKEDQEDVHGQDKKDQLIESIIKLSIMPYEIRQKKRGQNMSFKNTHHKNRNYSMKKYTGTVGSCII